STFTTIPYQTNAIPVDYILNRSSEVLSPILFVLMVPAILVSRKGLSSAGLFSAYSISGFLTFYFLFGHPVFRYYYIPVYALLLSSVVNRRALLIAAMAPIASLILLPSGAVQNLLPLIATLAILALQEETNPFEGNRC
ncbi:MAG: hypothetical protein KGI38_10740, partial [Thaumarchaeota archaeon]|nr:hypothetical protein [Nitrososphaerota archaeon]